MGIMTISLDAETEEKVRRLARIKYGGKKGAIQKVFKEAIDKYEDDSTGFDPEFIEMLDEGWPLNYKGMTRDEMHDRN